MAVDTNEKRLSLLNFGLPWWTTLPEPDGSIDGDDRLHLLNLYSGFGDDGVIEYPYSKSVVGIGPASKSVVGVGPTLATTTKASRP